MTDKLVIPANIPSSLAGKKCPELNPAENVWQFLRDNWLSNRVFSHMTISSTIVATHGKARRSPMAHHVHRAT